MLLGFLVILLALPTLIVGCSGVKGGGWFLTEEEVGDEVIQHKVTFSINLSPLDTDGNWTEVKGTIQLNDPSQHVSVHGISSKSEDGVFWYNSEYNDFYADVTVNGKEGYWIYIEYYLDEGEDWYWIGVFKDFGGQQYSWWVLESDIQGHIKY